MYNSNIISNIELISADKILSSSWPEPIWAIPGILPVGLSILAGAPKVGKSWLAMQITRTVAEGNYILSQKVEKGAVLYLALEDPPRRLQDRMKKQSWSAGLSVDFLTLGSFTDHIGDLRNGGSERVARLIENIKYRLVVIDTFSRAISGDQNDVQDMTSWLSPLHEMSQIQNFALLLIDHHRKTAGFSPDAIADILGSTAKGAMADTLLGLYREHGKTGAKLAVVGREVEEREISLIWDNTTCCWQQSNSVLTSQQSELLDYLEKNGTSSVSKIAKTLDRNTGNVYKQLAELEAKGFVEKEGKNWKSKEKQEN